MAGRGRKARTGGRCCNRLPPGTGVFLVRRLSLGHRGVQLLRHEDDGVLVLAGAGNRATRRGVGQVHAALPAFLVAMPYVSK